MSDTTAVTDLKTNSLLTPRKTVLAMIVEGVVVKDAGHWLMGEATARVVPALVAFLGLPE